MLSKQLYVWNAYLSLLGYNLVIAGLIIVMFFSLIRPHTGIEIMYLPLYFILASAYDQSFWSHIAITYAYGYVAIDRKLLLLIGLTFFAF